MSKGGGAGARAIAVIGAGAWGTALALHAARLGHQVTLWARRPESLAGGQTRLPGVALPPDIALGPPPADAALTLLATPTQHTRAVLAALRPAGPLLLCCKGVDAATLRLPLEIAADILPGTEAAILTGPNFAHEIAAGLPAAAVVAGGTDALRRLAMATLGQGTFRLYGNPDATGAQIGGAGKNVIAVAAGAAIGAGLGENARAALITRGLAELSRLAVSLGGRADTVAGLSGMGDLVLTCTGTRSRNFSLGLALGRGIPLAQALPTDGSVVEAVTTAPALLARGQTELPIIQAVAELLHGTKTINETLRDLLNRPLKDE